MLRKSHIIPEFLYKRVYRDGPRQAAIVGEGKDFPEIIQKGLREPLLCDECEGKIQKYEDYFAKLWYEDVITYLPPSTKQEVITYRIPDYAQFKLFHLSILWRASVASEDFWSMVSLGEHEETIRKMLKTADPKSESDYPITGKVILRPGSKKIYHDLLIAPTVETGGGVTVYVFAFGGCMWRYLLSTNRSTYLNALPLKYYGDYGEMKLPVVDARSERLLSKLPQYAAKALGKTQRDS
ncbi:MAG TPA: hypothetical protein VJ793_26650 [Anaerolineae bacterium]|nr:hypothetical protein [Anaerolineae bacterium]